MHWLEALPEVGNAGIRLAAEIEATEQQIAEKLSEIARLRAQLGGKKLEAKRFAKEHWTAEEIARAKEIADGNR